MPGHSFDFGPAQSGAANAVPSILRNESTPEARAMWAIVDEVAARAPDWIKPKPASVVEKLFNEVPLSKEWASYLGDPNFCFTDQYANMKANMKGCYCEFADDKTLQIDLDAPEVTRDFELLYKMAQDLELIPKRGYLVRASSGGNTHITISLDEPLPIERRILLQALLGSDLKREMLALAGYLKGQQQPVLLFRPLSEAPEAEWLF